MGRKRVKSFQREVEELGEIAKYFKALHALGIFTALSFFAGPLTAFFLPALLPGPLRIWGLLLGPLLSLIFLVFFFHLCRDSNQAQVTRLAKGLFIGSLVMLFAYISCWTAWVVPVNEEWHITGLKLTEEAAKAVAQNKVPDDARSLLDRFGHNSEGRIWASRGVSIAILIFAFAGTCAMLTSSFFLFVLRQVKKE